MASPASGFRRYVSNTSWMFASRVLRLLTAFLISVVVARHLGRDMFGRLNYAISYVMLFSALGSLGLNDLLVRDYTADESEAARGELVGTAVTLRLVGSLVMALLALASGAVVRHDPVLLTMMALVCVSYVLLNLAQNLERVYEAAVQARYSSVAQVLALAASATVSLLLVAGGASLVWFAIVKVVESAVLLLALMLFLPRLNQRLPWRVSGARARALLSQSWPLMLTGLFILVYMRIDQVMIAHFLGDGSLGCYAVAVRLSEAWYFVPSVVAASLFPAILSSSTRGKALYENRMQMLYELMTWLGIAVALPTTFLAPWVIGLVYGAGYAPAAPVLTWYIWAGVFVFQGIARGKWIIAEGLQRYAIVFTGTACVLNVALNALFIPRFGITGAAVATVVSCACQTLVIPCLFTPTRASAMAICRSILPTQLLRVAIRYVRPPANP